MKRRKTRHAAPHARLKMAAKEAEKNHDPTVVVSTKDLYALVEALEERTSLHDGFAEVDHWLIGQYGPLLSELNDLGYPDLAEILRLGAVLTIAQRWTDEEYGKGNFLRESSPDLGAQSANTPRAESSL